MIGITYFSEIVDSRVLATVLLQFWALPLLVVLYSFTNQTSPWVYYTVVTLITGWCICTRMFGVTRLGIEVDGI